MRAREARATVLAARRRRQKEADLRRLKDPAYQWAVPAERARALMENQQRRHHLSQRRLATAAGLPKKTLWALSTGRTQRVYPTTMRALLELPHLHEVQPATLPVAASVLRLQALTVQGWGAKYVHEILGAEPNLYSRDRVAYAVVLRIIEALREYGSRPGPSQKAAVTARNHGWRAMDAYDRELLLDPLWDGVGGLLQERLSVSETREEFWFLVGNGVEPMCAGARVGRGDAWVEKRLTEGLAEAC